MLNCEQDLLSLAGGRPMLLVQLGSESCSPCTAIRRKLERMAVLHPKLTYVCLPAEKYPKLCGQMGIFTVPTLLFYVQGKPVYRESGVFSLEPLYEKLRRCEELL